GGRQTLGQRPAPLPAERLELRRVERVTAVVPGAIVDRTDQRLVGAGQLEHARRDLAVLDLFAAADVVDLAGLALAQCKLDPGAVVLDVEPVADLPTV